MKKITKTIEAGGQKTAVGIRDRGTDTVWVFLHGWGGSKEVWRKAVRDFSATTVAVDLPGFGRSQDLDRAWSVSDYADHVADLIKTLELESVVLVGHSFGGQIAASLAAEKPDWLKGLVLVGAAVLRPPEPKLLSAIGSFLSPLFKLPLLRRLRPVLYRLIGADIPPEDENLKQTMRTILRENISDKLSEIKVPTRIIWGNRDSDAPTQDSEEITAKIAQSELSVLDGGHHIFLDAPEAFRKKLVDFHNQLQS